MKDYGFTHRYPYTNYHELNLDYILEQVERIAKENGVIQKDLEELKAEYNKLDDFYNAIMAGNFPDSFKLALAEWFEENAVEILGQFVKFVFFGLTLDGHFVTYIPESWNDIIFGTSGYDDFPPDTDFGHLTLSY